MHKPWARTTFQTRELLKTLLNQSETMSKQQKIHIFNCDRTYKLDVVKDWLAAAESTGSVEKHYFSLPEMTDFIGKTIPKLEMDVAVFVVHAHESRLSINEEKAGIGYATFYRALLQKTGKNKCSF